MSFAQCAFIEASPKIEPLYLKSFTFNCGVYAIGASENNWEMKKVPVASPPNNTFLTSSVWNMKSRFTSFRSRHNISFGESVVFPDNEIY